MHFYDTHVHLTHEDYQKDLPGLLERATNQGVAGFVVPGLDYASSEQSIELHSQYPSIIPAVGLHPLSPAEELAPFRELVNRPEVKAIGEIGTDKKAGSMDKQEERLRFFLDLAVQTGKPALIHIRDTWQETFRILGDYSLRDEFVIHCFTGGKAEAGQISELGGYLSVTAILARKGMEATLGVIKEWPLERLMLETDGPWLSWPGESWPNESTTVIKVAQLVADLRGISLEKVAATTSQSAERFFDL